MVIICTSLKVGYYRSSVTLPFRVFDVADGTDFFHNRLFWKIKMVSVGNWKIYGRLLRKYIIPYAKLSLIHLPLTIY